MTIEPFVLPRLDWYDEDGRIYKDALIENFNALEAKLTELGQLDAFDNPLPDISALSLEDVTLEDDDDKVVNLRSFLNIFNLINYPIELTFSGTTIKKISYWNSSYAYITRTNVATNLTEENKYLFYNFSNSTVRVDDEATIQEGETLLGVYVDGRVINLFTPFIAKLNLMSLLSNMDTSVLSFSTPKASQGIYFKSGQQAAQAGSESKGGSTSNTVTEEGK
jgi:hypothetical protein